MASDGAWLETQRQTSRALRRETRAAEREPHAAKRTNEIFLADVDGPTGRKTALLSYILIDYGASSRTCIGPLTDFMVHLMCAQLKRNIQKCEHCQRSLSEAPTTSTRCLIKELRTARTRGPKIICHHAHNSNAGRGGPNWFVEVAEQRGPMTEYMGPTELQGREFFLFLY